MKLTTTQLIQIAPLSEEVKKQALEKLPTLTDAQKFDLEDKLWESVADIIDSRKQAKLETRIEKAAKEGIEEEIDEDAIEDEVIAELLKHIDTHATAQEMNDVKETLENLQAPAFQPEPVIPPQQVQTSPTPTPPAAPQQSQPVVEPMQQHMMQPPQTPQATQTTMTSPNSSNTQEN